MKDATREEVIADAVDEAMGEAQSLLQNVEFGMCSDWDAANSCRAIIRALCKITGDNPESMMSRMPT
jgi:hypothetical protein